LLAAAAILCPGQKKKDEELPNQALEVLKDPPATVTVDPSRLVFRVAPLSTQGLLTQQIRGALKWLMKQDRGIVKLRAFVAGTGDIRRVQAIVSETFTDKRLPLPALTVIQAGALPAPGAQVSIESVAADPKRAPNPDGLAFISAVGPAVSRPLQPIRPLAEQALTRLQAAVAEAGVQPADVLRVTCYVSSLDAADYLKMRLAATYPAAAWNIVQQTRDPVRTLAMCDAVGRLRTARRELLLMSRSEGAIAIVNAPKIVISGAQLAFGSEESDVRLAFDRIGKSLEQAGSARDGIFAVNTYPLSWAVADRVKA
jgi:enamine deaminase RidA (YjgF/YER057c/UK114 family)